jgi:hypothetical protein
MFPDITPIALHSSSSWPGLARPSTSSSYDCFAGIQNAVRTIGQNINVSTCHAEILQDVDGRDKPGHDENS